MPKMTKKVCIITLGCPKNVVDSEMLMKQFQANNLKLVQSSDESDATIINTCGFIQSAKKESLDTIMHAVELKKTGRIQQLVVMGCLAERYSADLKKEIPEVDAYVGANKIDQVVSALGAHPKYNLIGERVLTTPPHYAYLKISEGCDRPCSFCSIPLMRGKHISKPIETILQEARKLAEQGVRELIIIAQESTYYGLDLYGKRKLAELLDKLSSIEGVEWIRLMYAFPTGFPGEVLKVIAENPKICKYLDIPLQHISNTVLASMKRGTNSKEIKSLINKIKTEVPRIALRTTLIVGYPNESEKEFLELKHFVEEIKFERLGLFTYSQEEDTNAFDLGDPVPEEVKQERFNSIMEMQRGISLAHNKLLVGKKIRTLIDTLEDGTGIGRTQYDAPEIDNAVTLHGVDNVKQGNYYDVLIDDCDAYDLFGRLANKEC
ncbi:MAG: 30S ribosomal protein S12 methylthiotransferase RimO [Ignavibacteriales bacterium]|nr:30S ribosomal protein S12 methylthiotransferase RimO [Ignavibacteriales bacterium]